MKAGKYTVKELFLNRYVERILIPEIQRDYVWGKDQVEGLLDSLMDSFEGYQNATLPDFNTEDNDLIDEFNLFIKKRNHSASVGFIYAYHDDEYPGRYYLIDGQQRITTIILLLLSLTSSNSDLRERFELTYLHEGYIKLDYKVRQSAHDFFNQFVNHVLSGKPDVQQQRWYYSFYNSDLTIQHILANYDTLSKYINAHNVNVLGLYDYIDNYTEMWYFDTNISEQGEELYIYMNARGEQVQANENIKADLLSRLSSIEEKNQYGKEWEEWQDFFWKNRGGNPNADEGFNEFLTSLSGLFRYLNGYDEFYTPEKFEANKGINTKDILEHIDLVSIKKYIAGLKYLDDNKALFKEQYPYAEWVDKSIGQIWKILNGDRTNWFADFRHANRGTERNKMVFVWGVLYYCHQVDLDKSEPIEVFRFLRTFYLRYMNFNRSVAALQTTVDTLRLDGVLNVVNNEFWDIEAEEEDVSNLRTKEELAKNTVLQNFVEGPERREIEAIIWRIEDHPYNLEGKDVGGTNITHLLELSQQTSKDYLESVCNKFYEVFPPKKEKHALAQNLLLYYGRYWYREKPLYYTNMKFNNWRSVIRERRDVRDGVSVDAFGKFWTEFLDFTGSLSEFYKDKQKNKISFNSADNLLEILLWYNQQLGDSMWEQGDYIAHSNEGYCGLPDWQGNDRIFPQIHKLYNTKGDLKGGFKPELYDLLPESIKFISPTNKTSA